jgi:hypothetical protein
VEDLIEESCQIKSLSKQSTRPSTYTSWRMVYDRAKSLLRGGELKLWLTFFFLSLSLLLLYSSFALTHVLYCTLWSAPVPLLPRAGRYTQPSGWALSRLLSYTAISEPDNAIFNKLASPAHWTRLVRTELPNNCWSHNSSLPPIGRDYLRMGGLLGPTEEILIHCQIKSPSCKV